MIQLEHISKKFKKKTILNDIYTHLRPEKFTVFMALTIPEKQCYSVSYPVWFSPTSGSIIINGKRYIKKSLFLTIWD